MNKNKLDNIIFFDGLCPFCSGIVRILYRIDKLGILYFSPIFGKTYNDLSLPSDHPCHSQDSILFWTGGTWLCKSDAALAIIACLPSPWSCFSYLRHLPRSIRDWAYDLFARYRHRIFGKYDQCMLPDADLKRRFLD